MPTNPHLSTAQIAYGVLLIIWLGLSSTTSGQTGGFINFESPMAHGLALTSDGQRLLAINTPGRRLSVYSVVAPVTPHLQTEVPVGLDPVSVAVNHNSEAWVVNQISDSVSVIDLDRGMVIETISVGDRPGDIVFAGEPRRAFVTSMNGRCVHVIDAKTRSHVETISIIGADPRTLAVSHDGKTVWVAIYRSGNGTTIVPFDRAPPPPSPSNPDLPPAPQQGIIVDSREAFQKGEIDFELADNDVFAVDANSLEVIQSYPSVGTTLFNLAEHPTTGEIWVANMEALNRIRFEPMLKGRFIENQITRISPASPDEPQVINLNPARGTQPTDRKQAIAEAIAQPTDVVFTPDGNVSFVTSFGTDRLAKLDDQGNVLSRIDLLPEHIDTTEPRVKRGPRSMAMLHDASVLYVLNRLSNSISVIDLDSEDVATEVSLPDPTPDFIREGRGYLFDAKLSANGTVSCASCHIDGDRDGLTWDLGDPNGELFQNGSAVPLHPMKGPLLTQTLKGLAGERIFHWRADRPGLASFNDTFDTLLGGEILDDDDLETFIGYMKSIHFGPSPVGMLDHESEDLSESGKKIFTTRDAIGREGANQFRCIDCHTKSTGAGSSGFTGTIGQSTKVAQLRGLAERQVMVSGQRVNGFGYGPDGSSASLSEFLGNSHRFQSIPNHDRNALEDFLLLFPSEIPSAVGLSCTVHPQNTAEYEVREHLEAMIAEAEEERCQLEAVGELSGRRVVLKYQPDLQIFIGNTDDLEQPSLSALLARLRTDQDNLSFYCLPLAGED